MFMSAPSPPNWKILLIKTCANRKAVSSRALCMLGSLASVGVVLAMFTLLTISVAQACSDKVAPTPASSGTRSAPSPAAHALPDSAVVKSAVSASFAVAGLIPSERSCGVDFCCTACSSGMTVECWSAAKSDVLQAYTSPALTWLPSAGAGTPFRPPLYL